jgi:hypothetical protein
MKWVNFDQFRREFKSDLIDLPLQIEDRNTDSHKKQGSESGGFLCSAKTMEEDGAAIQPKSF